MTIIYDGDKKEPVTFEDLQDGDWFVWAGTSVDNPSMWNIKIVGDEYVAVIDGRSYGSDSDAETIPITAHISKVTRK